MGNNQDERTNEQDRAQQSIGRAAASGFLCGVCDTPLLIGAHECVECGTPIAWEADGDDPTTGATAAHDGSDAPVLDLTGARDGSPATTGSTTSTTSKTSKTSKTKGAVPSPLPPLNETVPPNGVTFRAGGKVTAAGDGPPRSLSPALIGGLAALVVALIVGGIVIVSKGTSGSDAVAVAPTTSAPVAVVPPTTATLKPVTTVTVPSGPRPRRSRRSTPRPRCAQR